MLGLKKNRQLEDMAEEAGATAASTSASISAGTTTSEPHQPRNFKFPKRAFGNSKVTKRSFQKQWFDSFKWLHYDENQDVVYCYTCCLAESQNKLLSATCKEPTFIKKGFCNWKDAVRKFKCHEKSSCHQVAVEKIVVIPHTTKDVSVMLSKEHEKETKHNRKMLTLILKTIRFLARQGLPFRGGDDEANCNFVQALKAIDPSGEIDQWFMRKADKYTCPDIQNEILKLMALKILRNVTSRILKNDYFTIMCDECSDISNKEQLVVCFRSVDESLNVHENFVGLYVIPNISSQVILSVISDTLTRLNLSFSRCRGQCYDGASNMSGCKAGVAKLITDIESRAIFTHCYGHALNLAVGDTIKGIKVLRDVLDITYEISGLIKLSPKLDARFNTLKKELAPDCPGFRVLCPTRWTVRANSLKSVLDNYSVLNALWDECLEERLQADIRARILGVQAQMKSFDYFFGTSLAYLVLRHSDNLSSTLQDKDMSAVGGQEVVKMTVKTLKSLRSDERYKLFWENVCQKASTLGVDDPVLPRKRRRPQRYEDGNSTEYHPDSPEVYYKPIFFESIDLIVNCIEQRFNQPGFKTYSQLQNLLFCAIRGEDYKENLQTIMEVYGSDFDGERLDTQLITLSTNFPSTDNLGLRDIVDYIKELSPAQQLLYNEVIKLLKIILVMPATNALSERSFSQLRRIKNYLRSTMTQQRLNHCMILNAYVNDTDEIDLNDIAKDFIFSEHRQHVFGIM